MGESTRIGAKNWYPFELRVGRTYPDRGVHGSYLSSAFFLRRFSEFFDRPRRYSDHPAADGAGHGDDRQWGVVLPSAFGSADPDVKRNGGLLLLAAGA